MALWIHPARVLEQQVTQVVQRRSTGKRYVVIQPGQLAIWSNIGGTTPITGYPAITNLVLTANLPEPDVFLSANQDLSTILSDKFRPNKL